MTDPVTQSLAVALGLGLLIGAERERHKRSGPTRSAAGIRTFTVTSLAGAISYTLGGELLLSVLIGGVGTLAAVAYWRGYQDDPGLTTGIALIVTGLLGGLATQRPELAAGLGVTVAALLTVKGRLHRFVRSTISETEFIDALIFAGATLVVLPLVPNVAMGPYGALNPHSIWILVILVMAIGGMGYFGTRLLGTRFGLPVAGLASGFISSTATTGAMGARATKRPEILGAAVSGAVLSTVATVVQMALVLGATSTASLRVMSTSLVGAALASVLYAAFFTVHALQRSTENVSEQGRAFSPSAALVFALTLSTILVVSAALRQWFGETGIIVAAALAGFVDTHASAISVASLVASGKMSARDGILPILAGFSANTVSKALFASISGGRSFAVRIVPGLLLVALAAWLGGAAILLSP